MSRDASQVFGVKLREAREAKKLSQADLAERTGLQPSAISHFETGRRAPSFDNLKKLADALEVSTDYLLGREVAPAPGPLYDSLFRHAGNISADALESLTRIAEQLAQKDKKKAKP
jgi:transcriptional regulator with XRE-family HTH domain